MTKPRTIETNEGIQNEISVAAFDGFARSMRDKCWNGVDTMMAHGIAGGDYLELGSGPGYVGLTLAQKTKPSSLTGCEISPAMIRLAEKNAEVYGIPARYVEGNVMQMPFADGSFDCVFSNGSLHEWEDPQRVFQEIHRVLRPGGHYCITDLRRDVSLFKEFMVYATTKPKEMRPGLVSSLNAAYTLQELRKLHDASSLSGAQTETEFFGLCFYGTK